MKEVAISAFEEKKTFQFGAMDERLIQGSATFALVQISTVHSIFLE
jgi:hypothetical protein